MKWSLLLYVGLLCCCACQPDANSLMPTEAYEPDQDVHRRDADILSGKVTPIRAFLTLPNGILQAQGFQRLDKEQRRRLVRTTNHPSYQLEVREQGLTLQAKSTHPDDENEALPTLRLQLFQHNKGSTVVFLSEEYIHERTHKRTVLQQQFWALQKGKWVDINSSIPPINTATFFSDETPAIEETHVYLNYSSRRPNALQAHLLYEKYSTPNTVFVNEAYEIHLLWTGAQFELQRKLSGVSDNTPFLLPEPTPEDQTPSAEH